MFFHKIVQLRKE